MYLIEYYSTIKKHVTMPFSATWMDILIVILSDSHPHDWDVEQWGPPGFWHWISYQSLFPAQPPAWASPLSAITRSTLLNLCSCFIHLQEESLSDPMESHQQHKDDFPGSWSNWSIFLHTHTPSPISSLLVTNHIPSGAFDFWGFK